MIFFYIVILWRRCNYVNIKVEEIKYEMVNKKEKNEKNEIIQVLLKQK